MKNGKKVLVVDDERGIRLLLSEALLSQGFEVREARDGQESLDVLKEEDFDLVITDINMPRLDGVGMLQSMKEGGRKEKVIVMTGNPSEKGRFHEGIPNVVKSIMKPFTMEYFVNLVTEVTA
ncbi:MAG: response regulator [Deltaproteobacteria bacterium]|nr:response regulator [Deltaproteobacteria bacterium]